MQPEKAIPEHQEAFIWEPLANDILTFQSNYIKLCDVKCPDYCSGSFKITAHTGGDSLIFEEPLIRLSFHLVYGFPRPPS